MTYARHFVRKKPPSHEEGFFSFGYPFYLQAKVSTWQYRQFFLPRALLARRSEPYGSLVQGALPEKDMELLPFVKVTGMSSLIGAPDVPPMVFIA